MFQRWRFIFIFTIFYEMQLLLLQESWKELFLLHLAQWSIPWDLSPLLNSDKAHERLPADDMKINNEMKIIQEILARFRQLSPDGSECGCMKAVILFTPGKLCGFRMDANRYTIDLGRNKPFCRLRHSRNNVPLLK